MSELTGAEAPAGTILLSLRLHAIEHAADGVHLFDLRSTDGRDLPLFAAGSHIDVHLPNGLIRQYSLTNPREQYRYVIGVNRDPHSRGGSRFMHDNLRVGTELRASTPRNHFKLDEGEHPSVLIAGGIGITPIWAMIQRLCELQRPWTLHYCCRTPQRAAFLNELRDAATRSGNELNTVFDGEPEAQPLDVAGAVRAASSDAHFYCCGPKPLMAGFEQATTAVPRERVHVEYFGARPEITAADETSSFVVHLARSGTSLTIPWDRSILDAVLASGVAVLNSCREGVCGSCETRVLAGTPEHRDSVLSPDERAANNTMMICVSRCRDGELTLDL